MSAALQNFATLSSDERITAIKRLANEGHSEHGIAAATGLSVEQVRRILAERSQLEAKAS